MLTRKERDELERAKRTGYLVTRSRGYDVSNAFHDWCQAHGRPFVTVRPARKYATVELDMLTTTHNLSDGAAESARRHLLQASIPPADIFAGDLFCQSDRVPIEQAEDVARRLLHLATEDMERGRGA